jgi:hypothetical protein
MTGSIGNMYASVKSLRDKAQEAISRVNTRARGYSVSDRFKSRADDSAKGLESGEWVPPLKCHLDGDDELSFITARVRIIDGESERDINLKLMGNYTGQAICNMICYKENISESNSHMASLWIMSKDLELQVRPKANILDLVERWSRL